MFLNLGKKLPPTRVSPGGRVTWTVFLFPIREALWVTWHCPPLPGHLEMGGASSTHKAPGLCGTWNWGRSHLTTKDICTLMRSQQKRGTPEWIQAPPPEAEVGCDILPISSKVGPVLHHSPAQQLFFLCDFNYREQEDKGLGGGQLQSSTQVSPHHTQVLFCPPRPGSLPTPPTALGCQALSSSQLGSFLTKKAPFFLLTLGSHLRNKYASKIPSSAPLPCIHGSGGEGWRGMSSSSASLAVRSWAPDSTLSMSLSLLICTERTITLMQGPRQGPIPHSGNKESLRDPAQEHSL